jgi:flagellar basal body-associated protein FliL
MFNSKKIDLEPKSKQSLFVGLILLLVGALIALLVLLNFYFTNKLAQIQNLAIQNNQRIVQIENYLTSLQQQAQQKPAAETPAENTKK